MIRLVKISAYILFALLLPLWLYVMTRENINEKNKSKSEESQSLNVTLNGGHLDTLFAVYGKTFQNRSDSTLNSEVYRNINQLISISIANAQTLQGLLSNDRSISIDRIQVDVNQAKADSPSLSRTPAYSINDPERFPTFRVPYQDFENLIVSNNLGRTVYLYKDQTGAKKDGLDPALFLSDTVYSKVLTGWFPMLDKIEILDGMDIVLNNSQYYSRDFSKPFYIIGYFLQQTGAVGALKYFRIPVLIERTKLR